MQYRMFFVGDRVFDSERQMFGVVTEADPATQIFVMQYDDGEIKQAVSIATKIS